MGEGALLLPEGELCPVCKGELGAYRHGFAGARVCWTACARCCGTGLIAIPGLEKVAGDLSAFAIDAVDRMMHSHQSLAPHAFAFRRERMIALLDAALAFADCGDDPTLAPSARRASVRAVVRAAEDWANAKRGRSSDKSDE
jgi:hypothetical protein